MKRRDMRADTDTSTATDIHIATLNNYYLHIDQANAIDSVYPDELEPAKRAMQEVISLFSTGAVYIRAGRTLVGIQQIESFYTTPFKEGGRLGFKGSHADIRIFPLTQNECIAIGTFIRDDNLQIEFADLWQFAKWTGR